MIPLQEYSKKEMRYIMANPTIKNPAAPEKHLRPMSSPRFCSYITGIFNDADFNKRLNGHRISLSKFKKLHIIPVEIVRIIFQDKEISFQE